MAYSSSSSSTSLKRKLWSSDEDMILTRYVKIYGPKNWDKLANKSGLQRDGNSCRFRWMDHLNPEINRGEFTKEEDERIEFLQDFYGNKWSEIAKNVPRRTDNQIKNRWNTHLSKKPKDPVS